MNGEVIKTLAQYYANLNKRRTTLENPELCDQYDIDTNGVHKEHVETFWPPETRSTVNK